ncbi:MAG: aldehyde dehydrogenase family protein, partial [bacterium]|nr:aldehyde dehydrogenase family protein [bacterium]
MSISAVEEAPAAESVDREKEKWHAAAAAVKPEVRLFIDGDYVDAALGGRFETVNPATGEVIAEMAEGTAEDVDRAVASSLQAYRSGSWARMAPRERMEVLYRYAELIEEKSEELALLDTLDMGKPITDMMTVDMPGVVETFQYFAECIDKVESTVT